MAGRRLSMRKIKEILRLRWDLCLSERKVAQCCHVSRNTVKDYVTRAQECGLSWPLPDKCDLEKILFEAEKEKRERPLPKWEEINREMKRKGVTLTLLWEEYKASHPSGYQYSQFAYKYKEWLKKQNLSMRQIHKAGEKLYVDYAGPTIPVEDPEEGRFNASIFVATLGASHYTYIEASKGQDKESWLMAHVAAFEFMGGVPEIVVPDNLKSGVSRPCRYEPDINPSYQELAIHYDTAIIPARVRKPKDKAAVENAVLVVERWVLARLRDSTFYSLTELNDRIKELLKSYNEKPFQKRPGSRKSEFKEIDLPELNPLPKTKYEYADWKKVKPHVDYHVEIDRKYYSVPYAYHRHVIDVRITKNLIEGYSKGQRIMSHQRQYGRQRYSTLPEHMPPNHKWMAEWTPERFLNWAGDIGINTRSLIKSILDKRRPIQQGYRTCLGILNLARKYEKGRLEKACHRALHFGGDSYKSVKSILDKGLDRVDWQSNSEDEEPEPTHGNIRGATYYKKEALC